MFFQEIINGIVVGTSYALLALGFSIIYGVLRLINFAQLSLFTLGAYFGLFIESYLIKILPNNGWFDFLLTVIMAGVLTGVFGIIVALIAWWPIRRAPIISMVVSSLAILILLESLIENIVSPEPLVVNVSIHNSIFSFFGAQFSLLELISLIISVVLTTMFYLVIRKTKIGRAIRAVASNSDSAAVLGVNVSVTVIIMFAISALLAGVSGVLVSNTYGVVSFNMGEVIGLKGFTAAVLGGMGDLWGSVVGGLVLGVIESLSTFILPSQWTPAVAFAILILVLAIRPTGILSSKSVDRA